MNQTTTKVDLDDKKIKIYWFNLKKKLSLKQSKEISYYISLSSLITSLVRDCYSVSFSISRSLLHGGSLTLYSSL